MAFTAIQRRNRLCLTKTKKEIVRKGRKCKNTQKILLDGCYLLFEKYLQEKKSILLGVGGQFPRNLI